MSALTNELTKYKKRGFKVQQKRTLKLGKRIYLTRKKSGISGLLGGFDAVYIYYVDGDASTESILEFLEDYSRFYAKYGFDENDKGIFMCSGKIDRRIFNKLKKVIIKDKDVLSTIQTKILPRVTVIRERRIVEEEKIKEKITEREIVRRRVAEERISVRRLLNKIRKFRPPRRPKKEKELENMLISYLQAFYDVKTQITYERARIDAKIGNTGIEIKYNPSSSDFDRLYGQVEKYLKYLDNVIVVISSEKSEELINSFKKRLKERDWLNERVFVITL